MLGRYAIFWTRLTRIPIWTAIWLARYRTSPTKTWMFFLSAISPEAYYLVKQMMAVPVVSSWEEILGAELKKIEAWHHERTPDIPQKFPGIAAVISTNDRKFSRSNQRTIIDLDRKSKFSIVFSRLQFLDRAGTHHFDRTRKGCGRVRHHSLGRKWPIKNAPSNISRIQAF
jgi:hypothetical protein